MWTLSKAVGTAVSDERKSVTYAPSVNRSPDLQAPRTGQAHGCGAKSMPTSRRALVSEHDEELAGRLQGLSLAGEQNRISPPQIQSSTCQPLMMTSSLLPIFRSSLPPQQRWTLFLYPKMHVVATSPTNSLSLRPLTGPTPPKIRIAVSLRHPRTWQMTFRLLASSTRPPQRPLHSFLSTSRLLLTSRLPDLDVDHLLVSYTYAMTTPSLPHRLPTALTR